MKNSAKYITGTAPREGRPSRSRSANLKYHTNYMEALNHYDELVKKYGHEPEHNMPFFLDKEDNEQDWRNF